MSNCYECNLDQEIGLEEKEWMDDLDRKVITPFHAILRRLTFFPNFIIDPLYCCDKSRKAQKCGPFNPLVFTNGDRGNIK